MILSICWWKDKVRFHEENTANLSSMIENSELSYEEYQERKLKDDVATINSQTMLLQFNFGFLIVLTEIWCTLPRWVE